MYGIRNIRFCSFCSECVFSILIRATKKLEAGKTSLRMKLYLWVVSEGPLAL